MAKVKAAEALAMGVYNFHPRWTTNYSVSIQDRIQEFEDVIKTGYFNSIIVEVPYLNLDEFWRVILENDCTVWLNIYDYFDSEKISFEKWIKIYDDELKILKSHPERWERFLGVHYDEPIWRGQSNNDFNTVCGHFYNEYNLRNFIVMATGEFVNHEGNLSLSAEEMAKIKPFALKYVTDIAFDSYGVDTRIGTNYERSLPSWQQKISPDIKDGRGYYRELTRQMLTLCDHEVNVWFFPTAYTCGVSSHLEREMGKTKADEGYCIGHLEFFEELLMEQKHPAGLCLFTYYNLSEGNWGLQEHLIVKDENGNQKLLPDGKDEKWEEYSKVLREMCEKFRNTKTNPIMETGK